MATKFTWGVLLSIVLGISVFLIYFDFSILDPTNTQWITGSGGDRLQGYLGSFAFRNDTWHFPITKTTSINYPEGISIVYTDSNLFMSLLAKLFDFIFLPEYQFWGIWILLCWTMQSLFGYLTVHSLTKDVTYAILSAVLICLLPTMFRRLGHFNLIAHWLILAAIYIFVTDFSKDKNKDILFWVLFVFTSMIHAYLLFMVMSIGGLWFIKRLVTLKSKVDLQKYLAINLTGGVFFILSLWSLGYFYNQPHNEGIMGFGEFSMNLNGLINPVYEEYSSVLPILESYHYHQYEGYQYLGLGFIVLFSFFIIRYPIKEELYFKKNYLFIFLALCVGAFMIHFNSSTLHWAERIYLIVLGCLFFFLVDYTIKHSKNVLFPLLIPACICLMIALTYTITLGQTALTTGVIDLNSPLSGIYQLVRSSGRFYWVTNLIFITIVLTYLYKSVPNKKIIYGFMIVLLALQVFDIIDVKMSVKSRSTRVVDVFDHDLALLISKAEQVKFIDGFDTQIGKHAILQHKKTNDFYMAHGRGVLSQQRYEKELSEIRKNKFDDNTLYVFSNFKNLPLNTPISLLQLNEQQFAISKYSYLIPESNKKRIHLYNDSISLRTYAERIKNSKITITAVSDEASTNLPKDFMQFVDSTYHSHLSDLAYRNGYLSVFMNGNLIAEKRGADGGVEYADTLSGYTIYVKSAGFEQGNQAIIKINGIDYSFNQRGLNCVSIDANGTIHVFGFDTFEKKYPF